MKPKVVQYSENSSTASRDQTILFSRVHKKIYVIEILCVNSYQEKKTLMSLRDAQKVGEPMKNSAPYFRTCCPLLSK